MVTTRSDSNSSKSESEDEEVANLWLTARDSTRESDEFEEVILEYILSFTKEYHAQGY